MTDHENTYRRLYEAGDAEALRRAAEEDPSAGPWFLRLSLELVRMEAYAGWEQALFSETEHRLTLQRTPLGLKVVKAWPTHWMFSTGPSLDLGIFRLRGTPSGLWGEGWAPGWEVEIERNAAVIWSGHAISAPKSIALDLPVHVLCRSEGRSVGFALEEDEASL